jgi:hypothetical protein
MCGFQASQANSAIQKERPARRQIARLRTKVEETWSVTAMIFSCLKMPSRFVRGKLRFRLASN